MLLPGFDLRAAKDIFRVGLPSIITMGLSSMTSFFINQILLVYSTTATAVYGVWMKLQNFCYMPTFGLNNGMVPILSYNYGTRRIDRVKQTIRIALLGSASLMCFLAAVLECTPGAILTMFSAGEQMREIGMMCLRMCVATLPLGAVSMILSTSMQALDHSRFSLVINMLRQCVLLIVFFALISALTGTPVRRDVAMTGEVTLRGRVLPIGGLREKTMGALRAGVKTVIIPKDNEVDLENIDQTVRSKLSFVTAENVDDILDVALVRKSNETALPAPIPMQGQERIPVRQ